MLRLALRNVFRHKFRTGITLAAIAFGVVGLILSGGFVHDIFVKLGEAVIHSQTGHLQIARTGFNEKGTRKPDHYLIDDVARLKARVASRPEVDDVMARVSFSGLLNNGRSDLAIVGEGLEPDKEARMGTHLMLVAGRQLSATDKNGVLVGHGVAHALRLVPGDRVTILTTTMAGAANTHDADVVGVFQTFSKDYDARAIKLPLPAAQDMLGSSQVNTVVVTLRDTGETVDMARRLRTELAADDLEVNTWQQLNDFYDKTVRLYDKQFGVLRLIVLFMVLLSVANSVNMSVFERTAEIGTMRALGNRSRWVFRLVVTEALLLGLMGSLIGLALSATLALSISAIGIPMPPPPNADVGYVAQIPLVAETIGGALVVGVAAATLAGMLAGARVLRISVVDALRQAV
ncbi:MAG: ABC transporter permease [Betaproteobacteria bacterium]|nr:ABC transporter permease [Betaproteobacteria bacterium]